MSGMSDGEIREAIEAGEIGIENGGPDLEARIESSSLDIRVGRSFQVYKLGMPPGRRVIDLREGPAGDFFTKVYVEEDERFVINPGGFALATTIEVLTLSPAIRASLEGRSSYGRLGLVIHSTAGWIDPGFQGQVTLELGNLGAYPIAIYPGDRIGQLTFERLGRPAEKPYNGKYQGQRGATASRVHLDAQDVAE